MTYPPADGRRRPPGPPPYYPPQFRSPQYRSPQYPPPGLGGPRFPVPPRKPNGPGKTVAIVLAAVSAIVVVSLVALVVVNSLQPTRLAAPSAYPSPPPVSYSPYAPPTTSATVTPSYTTPLPSPTTPRTTALPQPTALPRPTSPPRPTPPPGPHPAAALGDNPLFGNFGLPKVQCGWPAYQDDLASQKAHFTAVFACLGKAWAPVLAAQNLPFAPPKVFVFDRPITTTGCGNETVQADDVPFHCDGTIYIPTRYFPDVEHILPQSFDVFIEMAAHEYGHYVQYLSGVNGAYHQLRAAAGEDSPEGLLLSRRSELQAQCFSGMFFAAALGPQDLHDAKVDANLRGDYEGKVRPQDHGTPERSGAWFGQGGDKNSTAQCNTWLASPDQVG